MPPAPRRAGSAATGGASAFGGSAPMRFFRSAPSRASVQIRDASPSYSSLTTAASSRTRLAIAPGKRWIAGFVVNASVKSIDASSFGSSVPTRRRRTSGPANAFCTGTCWSMAKPTSSANGSLASRRQASRSSVTYSDSGTRPDPTRCVLLGLGRGLAEEAEPPLGGDSLRLLVDDRRLRLTSTTRKASHLQPGAEVAREHEPVHEEADVAPPPLPER